MHVFENLTAQSTALGIFILHKLTATFLKFNFSVFITDFNVLLTVKIKRNNSIKRLLQLYKKQICCIRLLRK